MTSRPITYLSPGVASNRGEFGTVILSRPNTYFSPGVASVWGNSVTNVISRSIAHLSPGVASIRGKFMAVVRTMPGECPISVRPLRRDDFPSRGTKRDDTSSPPPGDISEGGKLLRGISHGLPVGTSVCPTCTSSTHIRPRLLNNREQSPSINVGQ